MTQQAVVVRLKQKRYSLMGRLSSTYAPDVRPLLMTLCRFVHETHKLFFTRPFEYVIYGDFSGRLIHCSRELL